MHPVRLVQVIQQATLACAGGYMLEIPRVCAYTCQRKETVAL